MQPAFEHDLAVIGPFRGKFAGRDIRTADDRPSYAAEPVEGSLLDDGFGELGHVCDGRITRALTGALRCLGWHANANLVVAQ